MTELACGAVMMHEPSTTKVELRVVRKSHGYFWFGKAVGAGAGVHVLEPFAVLRKTTAVALPAVHASEFLAAWRTSALVPCNQERAEEFFAKYGRSNEDFHHQVCALGVCFLYLSPFLLFYMDLCFLAYCSCMCAHVMCSCFCMAPFVNFTWGSLIGSSNQL